MKKKKLYLIRATSGDQWEISEGIYIVRASSKFRAKKLFKEKQPGGYDITSVTQLSYSGGEKFLLEECPIVQ